MIEVTLYSRDDCHLCEQAKADLDSLQSEIPHTLKVVDVDSDAKFRKEFGIEVPVVQAGPYRLRAPLSRQDLQIALKAAEHREKQIAEVDRKIKQGIIPVQMTWTSSDRFSYWLSRHYLSIFNLFVALYLGIPFLAPFLMKVGATGPATVIYRAYSVVCHQLAFRSWFLFGEQPVYPRELAGVKSLITFEQATGLSGADLISARAFEGNEILGYKVALCERDVAIYGGILLFGLLFGIVRRRVKSLHWALWLILGIIPIAFDGGSQLISQLPLSMIHNIGIPIRESTPLLRTLTGGMFGFFTAWFGYPLVEESMVDTRKYMEKKFQLFQRRVTISTSKVE